MEVARVAHFVQKSVTNFLISIGLESAPATVKHVEQAAQTILQPAPVQEIIYKNPVEASGFFRVTGPTEVTFYATTTWTTKIGPGWTALNITGMVGQIQTTGSSNISGNVSVSSLVSEPYNWSFTVHSDTDQIINGIVYANSVVLYPPNVVPVVNNSVNVYNIVGYYTILENIVTFFFIGPVPTGFKEGWIVDNIVGLEGIFTVKTFGKNLYAGTDTGGRPIFKSAAILSQIGFKKISSPPIYLTARAYSPTITSTLTTVGQFKSVEPVQGMVDINPNIMTGLFPNMRDLNRGLDFSREPVDFTEIKNQGLSSASIFSLFAKGPQDDFLTTDNPKFSKWNPEFKQHTNSIMFHRVTHFPGPSTTYEGNVVTVVLYPNQLSDLLSNMYLRIQLPSVKFPQNVGRAIIKQVDFIINETVIESLYDDWYVIRDQMLLDADEQYSMNSAMAGIGGEITIPLEFFFCRRHSVNNTGKERLRRPYFPTCAIKNQLIYLRFTFNPYTWWTDSPDPVDFTNPVIVTEEILLEREERMYYKNKPLRYIVNSIKKDSVLTFSDVQPSINLTASFPVQSLFWFFRNQNYENVNNQNYYNYRYTYGYTTQYIHASVPMTFPSGVSNFIDVITKAKLTLNNMDVTSSLPGGLYFGVKQPMDHFLSVPSKNIYSYSFGLTPKEYNQGGYLNFSQLNSQTTTLTLTFNPTYSTQVQAGYNLYVFYYGYNFLQFQGGFAGLVFGS